MTRLRSTIPRSRFPTAGRTFPPPAAVVPAADPRTALARSRDGVAEDVFGGPVVTTGDDERAPAVSHELTESRKFTPSPFAVTWDSLDARHISLAVVGCLHYFG